MSGNLILFDPFETLGWEVAASTRRRLTDFDVDPSARKILSSLKTRARLGVLVFESHISTDRLRRVLESKKLIPPLARELVAVAGVDEANPFGRLLREAGLGAGDRAVFVSLEADLRARALDAGLRVAPHPALAAAALDGEELVLVRLSARAGAPRPDWTSLLEGLPMVPVLSETQELYAIASPSAVAALQGSEAITLRREGDADLVARSTLCLFQAAAAPLDAGELRGFVNLLESGGLRLRRPTPTTVLFSWPARRSLEDAHPPPGLSGHGHTVVLQPDDSVLVRSPQVVVGAARDLDALEMKQLSKLDEAAFRRQLEALLRVSHSRHVDHPGNDAAVDWLKKKLANVSGSSAQLRTRYKNVVAEIQGRKKDLVVIGAHLDSTAKNQSGYRASRDPAPGADDNASGVVAVLEVARTLKRLKGRRRPERTIRFVLFNTEETGILGSKAYARYLKSNRAVVVEMLAMDMIGWERKPKTFAFEIHRGTDHVQAQAGSAQLAERLERAARQVAPHLSAQVSPRDGTDPASTKSDHWRFHAQGWPACLLSEDAWKASANVGNPHYHSASDLPRDLSFGYAADIARVVAAVAWMDANPTPETKRRTRRA